MKWSHVYVDKNRKSHAKQNHVSVPFSSIKVGHLQSDTVQEKVDLKLNILMHSNISLTWSRKGTYC